ncbi:hypothetical protein GOBAR_AA36627 [Gossypium barbadense]|uniref:Uncharacterized protein n=1 Tax=Gossypium barbadense TaxID=3634 RepID=A0A2P5VZ33_GOSBA|nr:hypothetical protein GOBAR_AA36627 [Gossypium barbadense]
MRYDTLIAQLCARLASTEGDKENELPCGISTVQHLYSKSQEMSLIFSATSCMKSKEGIRTDKVLVRRGDARYAEAFKLYGGMVMETRMGMFASEQRNKKQLLECMRRKTVQLESLRRLEDGQKFQSILALAGGVEALPAAASKRAAT